MKTKSSVILLSILAGLLAAIQAGAGLFWVGGSGPFLFTTLYGVNVRMNGQGIYFYDTYFKAPIFRGTDAVTLFVVVPLMVIALLIYRRGSLRGGLLLTGVLAYLLYNSASVALGAAYNNLFLVYIVYFSASLFAFILACGAVDAGDLSARTAPSVPRRGVAILMFVSALALLGAWLGDILTPLLQGGVPGVASYTTEVTYVFDLGIIVPVSILTGVYLLRRDSRGMLPAAILLVVLALVGLMVTSQTIFQSLAGIELSPGQFIGKAVSFMVLAVAAVWLLVRLLRGIRE